MNIARNFIWLISAEVISKLLGFVSMVYLARILNPENFGKLNFAFAVVTYFLLIPNMGLSILGIKGISRSGSRLRELAGAILALRLVLSTIAFLLLIALALFIPKANETKYLIILYGLSLFTYSFLIDWVFQGLEKMHHGAIALVILNFVNVVLIFAFVNGKGELLFIPLFYLIGNLTAVFFLFIVFFKTIGRIHLRFDLKLWGAYMKESLPIGGAFIMGQILFNIDAVLLGFLRSDAEVGYYSAAYRVVLFFILLSAAFHNALFPMLSSFYGKSIDRVRVKELSASIVKVLVLSAIPLAVGGTLVGGHVIEFIFGPTFTPSVEVFQMLIWAAGIFFVANFFGRALVAFDLQDKYLKIISIQGGSNFLLNLFLIPYMGMKGAALATVAGEVIGLCLYYREFSKVIRLPLHDYVIKPILASMVMAVILRQFMYLNVMILFAAGAMVYFIVLYLLKGVTTGDLRFIKGVRSSPGAL